MDKDKYESQYTIAATSRGAVEGHNGVSWCIKVRKGDGNYVSVDTISYNTPKEAQLALRQLKGLDDGES